MVEPILVPTFVASHVEDLTAVVAYPALTCTKLDRLSTAITDAVSVFLEALVTQNG